MLITKFHFPSNKIQKDLAPAQMTSAVLYQSTQKWNSSKRLTFARNKQQILKHRLSSCLLACSCSTALRECNTTGLGNKQNCASCHPRRPVFGEYKTLGKFSIFPLSLLPLHLPCSLWHDCWKKKKATCKCGTLGTVQQNSTFQLFRANEVNPQLLWEWFIMQHRTTNQTANNLLPPQLLGKKPGALQNREETVV